jgi:hypothetical protein
MPNISNFAELNYTQESYTSIVPFFKNICCVYEFTATAGDGELKTGVTFDADDYEIYTSAAEVAEVFLTSSKIYGELAGIFSQRNNSGTEASKVDKVIVFRKDSTDATYTAALTRLFAKYGDFAQIVTPNRTKADLLSIDSWCRANNRKFVGQTSDADVLAGTAGNLLLTLEALSSNATSIYYHSVDTEPLASSVASIMTNGTLFGSRSPLFATVSGVTPDVLSSTQETNITNANGNFYSLLSTVGGGNTDQYGEKWVFNGVQASGDKTQAIYQNFYIDVALKNSIKDFLARALNYEEDSNRILKGELTRVLLDAQNNDLIPNDTNEVKGFEIDVVKLRGSAPSVQASYATLYAQKGYKATGYFYNNLAGEKVSIDLTIKA